MIRFAIPISVSITLLRPAPPLSERIHEVLAGFAFRATFPVFLREADDGLHLPDEGTTVFADEQMQTKFDPRTRSKFTVDIGVGPFGYFATTKQFEHSFPRAPRKVNPTADIMGSVQTEKCYGPERRNA